MSSALEIRLHVEPGFISPGVIHVFFDNELAVARTEPGTGDGEGGTSSTISPEVEAQLRRFEKHSPETEVREVVRRMIERGWKARPPRQQDPTTPLAPYVRMVFEGSARALTLLANTVSLQNQ